MNTKLIRVLLFFALFIGIVSGVFAQRQTGSLRGLVIESEGNPLPGVTVTIKSESMLGVLTYVTSGTGAYRFPSLPPGSYTLTAEMTGFKTIIRKDIIIQVGMTVTIDINMETATVHEEVQVLAASPTVDVESSKMAIVMDRSMLLNLPLSRDLSNVINTVPGAVESTFHGSTVRGSTYALDGVNINDPVTMTPMTDVNFDIIDEVEIVTASHPAEIGYTGGAYINVVTRSGGNKFSGAAQFYFTNKQLSHSLWTDDELKAFGVASPTFNKYFDDGSLTLGGPVIKDKLWFFANARYVKSALTSSFIGPFTDFLGRTHDVWDYTNQEKLGLAKLTYQLSNKIKLMGMFNYTNPSRPVDESPGPYTLFITTRDFNQRSYTGTGILNFIFSQNAFLELKTGYTRTNWAWHLQNEAQDLPGIYNLGTLSSPIGPAGDNEEQLSRRFQTGLYLTLFNDKFLSGSHELKGGVEFEDAYADWDIWKSDNRTLYYLNNSPYYVDPDNKIGLIYFDAVGSQKGTPQVIDRVRRTGAYIQDSATFAKKLTLNIGIRFDRSWGWKPSITKGPGGPLSIWVGENVVSPYVKQTYPNVFPNGINPYDKFTTPEWKNVMAWSSFSPRLGLTYDPFGDGRTAFKASFSEYSEYMMIDYFRIVSALYPRNYGYYWQDLNNNGIADTGDKWFELGYDYRFMSKDFLSEMLDPNTKSPLCDEISVGIWREVFKNFSLSCTVIYKNTKNIFEDSIYNVDNGQWMYSPDQPEAKKWFVPFTTIVPGSGNYPDRSVTVYFRRLDSPGIWYRAHNVPELKRKYQALEIGFNKRMANGWQLMGSVVYSKSYGNAGMNYYYSRGWTGIADRPNFFVNSYGRLDYDRPLVIKLLGTAKLPYGFSLSTYFLHSSGVPWGRSAYILVPSSWAQEHNAIISYAGVYIDPPGTYRTRALDNVDLRLEKEFILAGVGRLGAFVDILNLLGYTDVSIGTNDIYIYSPSAENTREAQNVLKDPSFGIVNSVSGTRVFKLSLRFSF